MKKGSSSGDFWYTYPARPFILKIHIFSQEIAILASRLRICSILLLSASENSWNNTENCNTPEKENSTYYMSEE